MAATKDETESAKPTPTSRTAAAKKPEPPREDITGVLRSSRIGAITWTDRQGSSPEQLEGERHKMLAGAKKPGDEGYNPFNDPLVPSSTMATAIAAELAGSDGSKSPTWDALKEAEEDSAKIFQMNLEWRESKLNKAS